MDLIKILLTAVGCVILGVLGGVAARSFLAGVILAVFVFVGWFLWNIFKLQNPQEEKQEETKSEEQS
jgi:hypothetical protein